MIDVQVMLPNHQRLEVSLERQAVISDVILSVAEKLEVAPDIVVLMSNNRLLLPMVEVSKINARDVSALFNGLNATEEDRTKLRDWGITVSEATTAQFKQARAECEDIKRVTLTSAAPGSGQAPAPAEAPPPFMAAPQVPVQALPQVPVQAVPQVPVQAVPQVPVQALPQAPVQALPQVPVQAAPQAPVQAVPQVPVCATPQAPVRAAPQALAQSVPQMMDVPSGPPHYADPSCSRQLRSDVEKARQSRLKHILCRINGTSMRMLIDTGAEISVLYENQLTPDMRQAICKEKASRVVGVDGIPMESLGTIDDIVVEVGDKATITTFAVLPGARLTGILGIQWLEENHFMINPAGNYMVSDGKCFYFLTDNLY